MTPWLSSALAEWGPGHHMWSDGGNDHPWLWGGVMMLLLVAVIGLGVWLIVRSTRGREAHPFDPARKILAERLARGEITTEEYQERMAHLR